MKPFNGYNCIFVIVKIVTIINIIELIPVNCIDNCADCVTGGWIKAPSLGTAQPCEWPEAVSFQRINAA